MKWLVFVLLFCLNSFSIHAQTMETDLQIQDCIIRDEEVNQTSLIYNPQNLLEKITKFDSNGLKFFECSFHYDENGNKLIENHEFWIEGSASKVFNFYWSYDENGRVSSLTRGEGDELTVTHYTYEDKKIVAQMFDGSDCCIQEYTWEWNEELHFWEPLRFIIINEENIQIDNGAEDKPQLIENYLEEKCQSSFGVKQVWNSIISHVFYCLNYLERSAHHVKRQLVEDLQLPPVVQESLQEAAKYLFGKYYSLMGQTFEETIIGSYGEREINDKVRVSYVNGMLNTGFMLRENLALISETHRNVKVHFLFRPTEGWVWDASRAVMVKLGYACGFRSKHAHLLAEHWRKLIDEMGGVDGGGVIVHYAHSLGGTETDRARDLLTPLEQKMIRVITLGSPTLVENIGFHSVVNHISANDSVPWFDPVGFISHWFNANSNVFIHGTFGISSFPIVDHFLDGKTYAEIMKDLGKKFVQEFSINCDCVAFP